MSDKHIFDCLEYYQTPFIVKRIINKINRIFRSSFGVDVLVAKNTGLMGRLDGSGKTQNNHFEEYFSNKFKLDVFVDGITL